MSLNKLPQMKIAEFDLKWVHMARYVLILKQDKAIWLKIIFQPLLKTPRGCRRLNKSKRIENIYLNRPVYSVAQAKEVAQAEEVPEFRLGLGCAGAPPCPIFL